MAKYEEPVCFNLQQATHNQPVILHEGTAIVIKERRSCSLCVEYSLDFGSASLFFVVYAIVAKTKTVEDAAFNLDVITFFVQKRPNRSCQCFCRILQPLLPCCMGTKVEQRSVKIDLANQSINVLQFDRADCRNVALSRAQSRIGYSDYDNKWSNSQDFVRWCCTDHCDNPEPTKQADEARPADETTQAAEDRSISRILGDCFHKCNCLKLWKGLSSCAATWLRPLFRLIVWIIGILAPPALTDKCLIPLLFHTANGQPNWEVCFDVKNERCTCSMERLISFYTVLFGILGIRLCVWLAFLAWRCTGSKRVCCSNITYKRLVWDLADIVLDHSVAILSVLFELWLENFDLSTPGKLSLTTALGLAVFTVLTLLPEWILCCTRCDWGQATCCHTVVLHVSKLVLPQPAAIATTHHSEELDVKV